MKVLTLVERRDLDQLEATITTNLASFHKAGNALEEIKRRKLYRETHTNFADYCEELWEITKVHAYRLIEAAETVTKLVTQGLPCPKNEAQAREIAALGADGPKAWKAATDAKGGKAASVAEIRQAAEREDEEQPADEHAELVETILKRVEKLRRDHVDLDVADAAGKALDAYARVIKRSRC